MSTTVFRVEKNREFVVMHNKFLRERGMSLKAKGLLALCLSLPETWNYSINGLVSICKESQTSMRSALKELERFGYLKRNRLKDEKGMFYYEYVIYEEPHSGFVHADSVKAEKAHADLSKTENIRQENKEKENIKKENKKEVNIDTYSDILKHIDDIEIKNLFVDFIEMRRNIGTPISKRGLSMIINRCARLANFDRKLQIQMLEEAIINNWRNIYLPQEQKNNIEQQKKQKTYEELRKFYEED